MIRPSQVRAVNQPVVRYQIRAWGSTRYPDMNVEAGAIPDRLYERYPNIDIQRLDPVPLASFKDNLYGP